VYVGGENKDEGKDEERYVHRQVDTQLVGKDTEGVGMG
jgi:hypothetical protein